MIRNTIFVLAAVTLGSLASAFPAGEPSKPGELSPDEVAKLHRGLTLRFYAKADDAKSLDARRVRLAAFHVPQGMPPSPFLPAGPIHARLSGYFKIARKGSYTFRLTGTGTMALRIDDKELLKQPGQSAPVELDENYHKLEIAYASPGAADATLRLDWSGEKFGFEPLPPEMLFSRKDDADLAGQSSVREGRQLFAERHCASCHESFNKEWTRAPFAMPDVRRKHDAPRLDAAGDRFHADWLAAWIMNPRAMRPEATMPRVLHGADASQQAADIAAYLVSIKGDKLKPVGEAPDAKEGEAIFRKLGCDTCHHLDSPGTQDELARLSLFFVDAKFTPNALESFLKEPHKRYAWTRMPDFKLSAKEAGHVGAYLRKSVKGKNAVSPKGDAAHGEKLFDQSCRSCHSTAGPGAKDPGNAIANVPVQSQEKGCLAEKPQGKAPDFGFTAKECSALSAFLKTDGISLTRETPAEFSLRQVKSLRCDSCHRRDGESTRWHAVLEDQGTVPEHLPSLSWAGEKLQPAWTKKLLNGEVDRRARPWLDARMPAFPARAEMMSVGLSHEHGFAVDEDNRPKPDAKLAEIGGKLTQQQGGFPCNSCHAIGNEKALQPFAPGINLRDAAIRLRHNYYQRWMLAPDRVDVTVHMPVFAIDGKTSPLEKILDGDARRQFTAIWHHIQTLPE